jgi:putative PIG3 family NAD(P)H quinone oxidoreductase
VRAIEISAFGGPEVLRLTERPVPEPASGEVLIRVAAAGVNRPDLVQRQGKYPPPPGVSDLPGLEVAGVVEAVNPSLPTGRWRPGDRVMALVAGGGYAEFVSVPEPQCLPIPGALSMVEAAGMPETFFTVWTNVFERGQLEPGETLLVHGGASGIGTTAIQLAAARDSRVFATAGTAEKCAACERLGAARAINYRTEDFAAVVRELTGGRGVDVILDMVGGPYTPRNLGVLAVDGRLVQIALMGGSTATIDLNLVMRRRLTVTGSTLRPRSPAEKGTIARALEVHVWPLVAAGAVRPVIHATLPLAEAAAAHRLLEEGNHIGKVVLRVAD